MVKQSIMFYVDIEQWTIIKDRDLTSVILNGKSINSASMESN